MYKYSEPRTVTFAPLSNYFKAYLFEYKQNTLLNNCPLVLWRIGTVRSRASTSKKHITYKKAHDTINEVFTDSATSSLAILLCIVYIVMSVGVHICFDVTPSARMFNKWEKLTYQN